MTDVHARPQRVGSTTAPDGARIAWRTSGSGPGLVVVHGAMGTGADHTDLAAELGGHTVHRPDRREHGPGIDGTPPAAYGDGSVLAQDVADLLAVLRATGSRAVLGVSSGAIVALQTALTEPGAIDRLVLFEPPLLDDAARAAAIRDETTAQIAAGDVAGALVTGWRAIEMGPALIRRLPTRVLRWMVGQGLAREARKGEPGMGGLAPSLPRDFSVVAETAGALPGFARVGAPVLLVGTSRSPGYLGAALDRLEHVLPHARRVRIDGAGHEAPLNRAQRGRPELVASAVHDFLATP